MFLFLALFSCEKEVDSFHPIEEAEVVTTPVVVSSHPDFQKLMAFISSQVDPKTGRLTITEEALFQQFDLSKVAHDHADMLNQINALNHSADALSQYLIDNILIVDTTPSYGKQPCYQEYKQSTINAAATLGICASSAASYEEGAVCIIRFGLNLINADTDFNQCLQNTYPNADYP